MAKKKRRADHARTPKRPTVVRRQVEQPASTDLESQPLFQMLKRALYGDHPLELLDAVSGLLVATQPRPGFGSDREPNVAIEQLVESFEGTDAAPTTAALHVIAAMTADELLAARIRRELGRRHQPMPTWLRELPQTRVAEVVQLRHVLRDGENYFFDVRLPDRYAMTVVLYVDNNMGQVVKDAFTIPERFETVRQKMAGDIDEDSTLEAVDPRETRALLESAVRIGAITFPPLESDTWPLCRPLVEWLIRLLPPGAEEPEWRAWTDAELDEATNGFLGSSHGAAYDDQDHRELVGDLLWFGTGNGTGDPLRWTPVNVEILLVDWFPRKIVADVDYLTKLPRLLSAFICHAHEESGISAHLTAETLESVARWAPEYQRLIRTERPQGAVALARMLLEAQGHDFEQPDLLEAAVGGAEALAALTVEPLPDEDFDWTGIAADIAPKIAEILALCDENAMEFLDLEHRTANRRLLRAVALADPAYFRGRAAARTSAAAVSWMIAHANASVGLHKEWTTAELLAPFGVPSASERAKKFRKILGLQEHFPSYGPMGLESPDYLVSGRRAEIIEERECDPRR